MQASEHRERDQAILGIDVGGTHTDAVLIDRGGMAAQAKVPTDPGEIMASLRSALEQVLAGQDPSRISRFSLSTTLCTNAIVQDKTEPVGVLVSAGAGLDPERFALGDSYVKVDGALDHRGAETAPPDPGQIRDRAAQLVRQGLRVFAAVGKFSPRNPEHEQLAAKTLAELGADFVTSGHTLSGQLNFPRRIATSYYNSAVWRLYDGFVRSVSGALQSLGLEAPVHVLKADGGTMPMDASRLRPVETILSGPAASVMGIVALCEISEDAVLLDIGGTTTDIAVFASGAPLLDARGATIRERPTLIRALDTRSIGIGGDSAVRVVDGTLRVGPERLGKCLALGGPAPTLVDALNVLEYCRHGEVQASIEGLQDFAARLGTSAQEAARAVLEEALRQIAGTVEDMLETINSRPVYTVHEVLEDRQLAPSRVYLMGGPAQALADHVAAALNMKAVLPSHFAVANAVGAALARPTMLVELFADTSKRIMRIPLLGVSSQIPDDFSLESARNEVRQALARYMAGQGLEAGEAEIVEESAMNMVRDYLTVGQDIRVKCQIKPGISPAFQRVLQCLC